MVVPLVIVDMMDDAATRDLVHTTLLVNDAVRIPPLVLAIVPDHVVAIEGISIFPRTQPLIERHHTLTWLDLVCPLLCAIPHHDGMLRSHVSIGVVIQPHTMDLITSVVLATPDNLTWNRLMGLILDGIYPVLFTLIVFVRQLRDGQHPPIEQRDRGVLSDWKLTSGKGANVGRAITTNWDEIV